MASRQVLQPLQMAYAAHNRAKSEANRYGPTAIQRRRKANSPKRAEIAQREHGMPATAEHMPPSVRISVHIQPRARRTEIAGRYGSDIKIRVAAPPIDHAANEALLAFVADRLGVRQRDVRLIAGATSRRKVLEIDGIPVERIHALLA